MSRYDEAHEKWFEAHIEECRRDLVIGARVYRAGYDKIEEGTVRRIERIRYDYEYHEVEDPNGPYTRYIACFGFEWESQTTQYKFFYRVEDARKKLAEKLRDRAKDARQEADRWDALASTYETPILEVSDG